jgi:AcrR family transcriptional regulator
MARPSKRQLLLDAAAALVRRDGAAALTLEAVAAEAGLSKAGVVYHFGGVEPLVAALLHDVLQRFDERVSARLPDEPEVGAYARAYLAASAEEAPDRDHAAEQHLMVGLLPAVAGGPAGLAPLRARAAEWSRAISADGLDPVDATLLRLATDGLWFADLLGLAPPAGPLRAAVLARLDGLSRAPPAGADAAPSSTARTPPPRAEP